MKKQINTLLVLLFSTAILNHIVAQTNEAANGTSIQTLLTATETNGVALTDVSAEVQKKFKKTFPDITGESWGKTENGYVVRFTSGSTENWAFLDKKGNCTAQIHYYHEELLPKDIRARVKSIYYDYSINCIKEVSVGKDKVYLVTLEDKNSWKIIAVTNEDMNVYREYVKG